MKDYVAHYHTERNHQGKNSMLLFHRVTKTNRDKRVLCRERLRDLLRILSLRGAVNCGSSPGDDRVDLSTPRSLVADARMCTELRERIPHGSSARSVLANRAPADDLWRIGLSAQCRSEDDISIAQGRRNI